MRTIQEILKEIEKIKQDIRDISESNQSPVEKNRDLSKIWKLIDKTNGLLEARTRINFGRMNDEDKYLNLPELPSWAKEQIKKLRNDNPFSDNMIRQLEKTIQVCMSLDCFKDLEGDIYEDEDIFNLIAIKWNVYPHFLLFYFKSSLAFNWPGINVKLLKGIKNKGSFKVREVQQIYTIHSLIDEVQEFFNNIKIKIGEENE